MKGVRKGRGFTLLELVITVAVIAILGLIGVIGYQKYTQRARAADIVVKYDAIRSGVGAEIVQGAISNCADVVQRLGTANLADEYARLGYGFEAVAGGYRPVLTVCAKTDKHGAGGVEVARGAHDTLAKTAKVEKGAVLTDTLVSFAVPLSDSSKPVCTVPLASPTTVCGDPAVAQLSAPVQSQAGAATQGGQPSAPAQTPVAQPPARPVPPGLKAGVTPSAPWVRSDAASWGVTPMTERWTESEVIRAIRAQSPDGTSPIKVTAIDVDPAKAIITRNPDGSWQVNFLTPYNRSAHTLFTVRVSNGAGENSAQINIRGH